MKLSRKRLMEAAGLLKEATTDRDAIAHFVWGQEALMDKGEDDIEEIINQIEEEWEASKANYGNVDEYLEELENEGGMEMFLNEIDSMIAFTENRKIVEAFDKLMSHINSAQQKNKLSPNAMKALEVAKEEIDKLPK